MSPIPSGESRVTQTAQRDRVTFFICARCGAQTHHFGALLGHWRAEHQGVVR